MDVKNNATGVATDVTTNADGFYTVPNLTPGVYTVTITATGFQKSIQNNVTMTVGGNQTLNLSMQVGQATQTVEVTAEAPTVNLANAEIGALTTESAIKELPLNGRSWSDLANLTSGVYELHVHLTWNRATVSRAVTACSCPFPEIVRSRITTAWTVSASTTQETADPVACWAPIPASTPSVNSPF